MKIFKSNSRAGAPDYIILFGTLLLITIGLAVFTSASSDLGKLKFNDSYYYLKHQLIYGLGIGTALFWFTSKFYYKNYQKLATALLLFSFFLLVLVLFTPLGKSSGGSLRWLKIGSFIFQPSEILKATFIIYLASWLSGKAHRLKSFQKGYLPFLIICGVTASLLIFQPSTSAAVILMFLAIIIYFFSGAKLSYIVSTIILGLAGFLIISYFTPYRWERLKTFLNPDANTQTSSYQITWARIAIGSGGLWGKGFGQSTTKLHYLPQPIDDSIFAIIAEELGFIGAVFIISIFVFIITRSFLLVKKTSDKFGQLLLIGFGSLIGLQTFIHISAISGLLPLTGIPLPYISYGGTALAVFMAISGIMVNISKYHG